MKKRLLSLLFISATVAGMSAATQWDIQGKTYAVDTTYHAYVGPGTTRTDLSLSGPSSLKIFYTTTDLSDPYVEIRAVKGQDKVLSVESVSKMAERKSQGDTKYFSGVNADFFSTSTPMYPIGSVLVDGEPFYTNNGTEWHAFGINDNKTPFLGTSAITGSVKSASGSTNVLSSVNTPRYTNYLTLYTSRYTATTGTNIYGSEVQLELADGSTFGVGKTTKMKVVAAPVQSVGSMSIPTGGFVLSGNGTSAAFVNSLAVGDVVEISTAVAFNNADAGNVTQIVGGQPMILSNGEVLNTESVIDHLVALHPRTAVGYSADKKKLVMLVVDGRSSISAGTTSKMLADIMKHTGCTEALNFDGGGSTEMYSTTFGIVNKPSEGTERSVADGLFVATSVPQDNQITQIRFKDAAKSLPKYGYYIPTIYGYNKYGVLVDTDVKGITIEAPAGLGEIVDGGTTLFCNGEGTHAFTARYNGIEAKMPVTVSKGTVSFRLESVIEDGYKGYKAEVMSEIGGESYMLDNRALTWRSEDTSIATVDADNGLIKGVANGTVEIHGTIDGQDLTLNVIVEKPTAFFMPIESAFDPSTWVTSQAGGTKTSFTTLENGFSYAYTGASGRAPSIKFTKTVTLWSVPDSIHLRINPQGAPVTAVTFSMKTATGKVVNTKLDQVINQDKMNIVSLATADWAEADDRAIYPITLNSITLSMGTSTTGTEYNILVPGLEAVYNALDPSGVESTLVSTKRLVVYPNPVEKGQPITIENIAADTEAIIYNVSGTQIAKVTLAGDGNTAQLSTATLNSGIYIIVINNQATKLIVK